MRQLLNLQVVAATALTGDIRSIALRHAEGKVLPPFAAGAHVTFRIVTPAGDISRNYSLINAAAQGGQYEIAVLRRCEGAGGSRFMCDGLKVGDIISASPPKNDFPLSDEASEHILIAGGIGVTPILSMAETLAAGRRRFALHYSARTPGTMAFRERAVASAAGGAQLYFDEGDPRRGVDLSQALGAPDPGRHAYVCGPRGLIDAAIATARRLGWRDGNLHFESFAAPALEAGDRAVEVFARASNMTIRVPADRSILDCLIEAGLDPLFDCKRGECGACVTAVVEGSPDHRDYVLDETTRASGTSMCICVSRARSDRLVLEI